MPRAVLIVLRAAELVSATPLACGVGVLSKRVKSTNNYIAEDGVYGGRGVRIRASRKQYVVV